MATFARTRLLVLIVVLIVPAVLFPLVGAWTFVWLPVALMLLGVSLARPETLERIAGRVADLSRGRGGRASGTSEEAVVDTDTEKAPRDRSDQGDEPEPVPAPRGESGTRGVRLRRTELPSALPDYDFVFSARVHWRWARRVDLRLRAPAGPASYSILLRAREVLGRTGPEDRGLVEAELAALFAVESPIAEGVVEVWADEIRVELADEDEERLRRVVDLRKDRALWEAEHEAERVRRTLAADGPSSSAPPRAPRYEPEPSEELSGQIIEHLPDHAPAGPGSGIDDEGYESYWWPAEDEEDEHAMQQDVQVAILRGLIDSVEDEGERAAFVREQVRLLEQSGFPNVAERILAVYPER
ncbi:hypothetical protein ABZ644_07090 [Nocardiopsis alba]|uniref:hypothetical protein n=1 Tax=Nocardiopsis alba TaxID=53437 RepID=UPI0033D74225